MERAEGGYTDWHSIHLGCRASTHWTKQTIDLLLSWKTQWKQRTSCPEDCTSSWWSVKNETLFAWLLLPPQEASTQDGICSKSPLNKQRNTLLPLHKHGPLFWRFSCLCRTAAFFPNSWQNPSACKRSHSALSRLQSGLVPSDLYGCSTGPWKLKLPGRRHCFWLTHMTQNGCYPVHGILLWRSRILRS